MGIWKHRISGAGVILIEKYTMKNNGKQIYCVVLAKNKCSQEYSDFGGSYETKHNDPKNTAKTELLEESRNLLNIHIRHFNNYYDIPAGKYIYRIFLLKINNIRRKMYIWNMHAINKHMNIMHRWDETCDITHIPILNMHIDKRAHGKIYTKDVYGKQICISGRTSKALRIGYENIIDATTYVPLKKHVSSNKNNKIQFLRETLSILVF